ncbi:dihydrofolate reductase-like domain-containing protein [Suillus clintonianus]|uniref:dihydrofolate reductase-like domain-containing protein n=1 Tax=Suillus clintonianus TaxID=1904413 RepID=UPI001B878042|nr:dihydrofolate reductase-like domain-containing protein [Suillus clintonianus]KAG2154822.1 dihydrofolate reductase-like domain-containing protein [Suillus clintonianus]
MSHLTIIVAATKSNGIGQHGKLPWRLSKEMAYFARVTSTAPEGWKNAVIMGRKTWESIPTNFRPLPKRLNVVISHNKDYELAPSNLSAPVHLCSNLTSAVESTSQAGIHRRFIIGGASLISETLNPASSSPMSCIADRVLLTRILAPDFLQCDIYMPDFLGASEEGKAEWKQAAHDELVKWVGFDVPAGVQEEKGISYEFQMWLRQ